MLLEEVEEEEEGKVERAFDISSFVEDKCEKNLGGNGCFSMKRDSEYLFCWMFLSEEGLVVYRAGFVGVRAGSSGR